MRPENEEISAKLHFEYKSRRLFFYLCREYIKQSSGNHHLAKHGMDRSDMYCSPTTWRVPFGFVFLGSSYVSVISIEFLYDLVGLRLSHWKKILYMLPVKENGQKHFTKYPMCAGIEC